jgi:hypothetical protein
MSGTVCIDHVARAIHIAHTLSNRVLDENGVTDKYGEFVNSDFDNDFQKLEEPDYEIRASQVNVISKEDTMKGTRKDASYVGELSSGFDAKVQDDYEAGQGQKGQEGKGHEEEVAAKNNWEGDKRDAIGRAASVQLIRRMAANLSKLADSFEGKVATEEVDEDLESLEADVPEGEFEDLDDDSEIEASVDSTKKQAAHPIEHDVKKDDPGANQPSDTGDEWIDIGPGEFGDKRDEVGKAAESK